MHNAQQSHCRVTSASTEVVTPRKGRNLGAQNRGLTAGGAKRKKRICATGTLIENARR